MTTLDDKLLGEKLHYYCSSSSEGSDDEEESGKSIETPVASATESSEWNGLSRNTGPKGVIEDWQKYKQLQREQLEEAEKDRLAKFRQMAITCAADNQIENIDDEESDEFLLEYRKKRMQEMMAQYGNKSACFGAVFNIKSPNEFLKMVDEEEKTTTIIVHVYDNNNTACLKINDFLGKLAEQYKHVKFCKVLTTAAGLSLQFKIAGVPAFLVYKNKQIIGNFIKLTTEFSDDFCEGDVENFLIENGILGNQSSVDAGEKNSN